MGFWEHDCVECKASHDALLWYYRDVDTGKREYLCGDWYSISTDQGRWQLLDPSDEAKPPN